MNCRHIAYCLVALSLTSISHGASEWGPWQTLTTKDNVQLDFRILDGKQYDQVQWRAANRNGERVSFSVVDKRYYTAGSNRTHWKEGPDEGSDVAAGKTYGLLPDTVETNIGEVEARLEVRFLTHKEKPKTPNPKPNGSSDAPPTTGSSYWNGTTRSPESTADRSRPAAETTATSTTNKGTGSAYWSGQATGGPVQPGSTERHTGSKLGGASITRVPDGPPNGSIRPKDTAAKTSSGYWSGGGNASTTQSTSNQTSSNYWGPGGSSNTTPSTTPSTSRLAQDNRQLGGSIRDTQDQANAEAAARRRREAAEEREAREAANARRLAAQQEEDDEDLAARIAANVAEQNRFINQLRELSGGNFNPPPVSQPSSSSYKDPGPLLTSTTADRTAEVDLARRQQEYAAAKARQQQEEARRAAQMIEEERRQRAASDALRVNRNGAR